MYYEITDKDSYLKARAHWRAQYAAISANQRNIKTGIRETQQAHSAAEVFSYDWPQAKQIE